MAGRARYLLAASAAVALAGWLGFKAGRVTDRLDQAITHSYRCDQMNLEAGADLAARALLQRSLEGFSRADLLTLLDRAGLGHEEIPKGAETVILTGPDFSSSALSIVLRDNRVTQIEPLPGPDPCPVRP